MEHIYQDMALRTGGDIYIGVVGPVRTGKSTLIKRIMEQLVIPGIEDPYKKERARDELPQSGSGRIIMTSEPKFIPEEAAQISPDGISRMQVRFIDSVGYMVEGAVGAYDEGVPRMVTTPWFDHEIPMTEAAELGTQKVMQEHGIEAHICDCQSLDGEGIGALMQALLYQFPLHEIHVHLPRWLDALERAHPVKELLYTALLEQADKITVLAQAEELLAPLGQLECVRDYCFKGIDLGTGTVSLALTFPEEMFYRILSDKSGMVIRTDSELLQQLTELAKVKREYERVSDALNAVMATGYGVVMPTMDQMQLENPELTKKGGAFGVKLKAAAPSIHMMRVDVDTQINPVVGDENQSRDLVRRLSGAEPEELCQSNIFGKSVYELLQEGLSAKAAGLPQEVRGKFRGTLSRIVNEGATGLVCLIL